MRPMRELFTIASVLLLITTAAFGQNHTAIEYESLMTMRFYEATGGFLVEGLEVVFPPAGNEPATFMITKPGGEVVASVPLRLERLEEFPALDRKSTRLNSSHSQISYAVFCLKKKIYSAWVLASVCSAKSRCFCSRQAVAFSSEWSSASTLLRSFASSASPSRTPVACSAIGAT